MSHVASYFDQAQQIIATVDLNGIEKMADALADLRNNGDRLFFNWRLRISHVRAP